MQVNSFSGVEINPITKDGETMSFLSDHISLNGFAEYYGVTERTARTWINEEPVLSEGVIRRNNSVFIGTGPMIEFEDKYLFGESNLDSELDDF